MVSAIILSYNRAAEVLKTVGILKNLKQTLPFDLEIVVVDNASVDDTSAQLRNLHPDINLVTKATNNGIAGWNEGFKAAKYDYFLVLDDDSHPHSGLEHAIGVMQADKTIGILALQIKDEKLMTDPHLDPDEAWKDGDDIAGFIGCGAIISRELYSAIGGFAEWIYVYTHEFEYAIRCLNAGYKIKFCGQSIVIHRVSKINRLPKMMRIYATRNEMAIIYKYFKAHRSKFLFRVLINNLKFIKREGLIAGYYILVGAAKFLTLRRTLPKTFVKQHVQTFFEEKFWATQPIFINWKRKVNKKLGKAING